jgi:carboxylesterase type B
VLPTSATNAVKAGNFNKVPQIVGNTSEEGKLFSSAFKIDDYTRVKWMNGTYLGTASGLQLQDIVDASIVSPLTVDNYNTYTYNNANHITPAPSITTATFWALSNASNTAYYPQVPLYAYDFKWNEEPAPWNDVYGAWHAEDLAFIFGNFTMKPRGVRLDQGQRARQAGPFQRDATKRRCVHPDRGPEQREPRRAMGPVDTDRTSSVGVRRDSGHTGDFGRVGA